MLGLSNLRRDKSERQRFRAVLRSATDPRHGSYQLGYLFICAIETLCQAHANTDLLLGFLRDYFFVDFDLAVLILDESIPADVLYGEVRSHLQAKVFELITDPEATAERLGRWASEVQSAPLTRSTVDDFFGRTAGSSEAEEQRVRYASRLHDFCDSVGSEIIPARTLEDFLVGGRMLMPLGSSEAIFTGEQEGRFIFETDNGGRIGIAVAEFSEVPSVGENATITMLVNVASPGSLVSFRWRDKFEVVALGPDTISKPIVEQAYHQSEIIGEAVQIGQDVIGALHRVIGGRSEPIEAFVDEHLESDAAALDVLQIYRAPISHAFTRDSTPIKDSQWRMRAFAAWQPRGGVFTALQGSQVFDDFLEICGMPITVRVDTDHLIDAGIAETISDAQRIADGLFEAASGLTRERYDDITQRASTEFLKQGLAVFGTSSSGVKVSLI